MTDHVPAWKRLGLKLKYAKDSPSNHIEFNSKGANPESLPQHSATDDRKRKSNHADSDGERSGSVMKKARTADQTHMKAVNEIATPQKKRLGTLSTAKDKKSVSFASDTKNIDGDSAQSITATIPDSPGSTPKRVKKEKKPKSEKSAALANSVNRKSRGALEYVSQHFTSRQSWKFNKNQEVWILRHALSPDDIPVRSNAALLNYVYGLKSASARERLIAECQEALRKDESAKALSNQGQTSSDGLLDQLMQSLKSDTLNQAIDNSDLLKTWIQERPRPELLLWGLQEPTNTATEILFGKPTRDSNAKRAPSRSGIDGKSNGHEQQNDVTLPARVKKNKARTSRIEIDSDTSSSGDSSSDDSSSSESDSKPPVSRSLKALPNSNSNYDDETSSDASSTSSEDETSDSDSDSG